MDINKILRADYLDIIFEGRNKAYGGYELRKKYSRRSRRAGMLVVASAVLLSAIPTLASMMGKKAEPPRVSERIIEMAPPPVLPKKEIAAVTPPPPPRQDFNPPPTIAAPIPRVVEDDQVEQPPATNEDMSKSVVALVASEGDGDPRLALAPRDEDGVPGGMGVEPPTPVRTIHKFVEQQAQSAYDLNAWLAAHLRYPDMAQQAGQEGRSLIQFVVNEDGSITDVRLVRSSYPSLDAEALRVVRSMPNWKPGKQNGTAVASYFTLPITFELN